MRFTSDFKKKKVASIQEVSDGVNLDFDTEGRLIGLEVLSALDLLVVRYVQPVHRKPILSDGRYNERYFCCLSRVPRTESLILEILIRHTRMLLRNCGVGAQFIAPDSAWFMGGRPTRNQCQTSSARKGITNTLMDSQPTL